MIDHAGVCTVQRQQNRCCERGWSRHRDLSDRGQDFAGCTFAEGCRRCCRAVWRVSLTILDLRVAALDAPFVRPLCEARAMFPPRLRSRRSVSHGKSSRCVMFSLLMICNCAQLDRSCPVSGVRSARPAVRVPGLAAIACSKRRPASGDSDRGSVPSRTRESAPQSGGAPPAPLAPGPTPKAPVLMCFHTGRSPYDPTTLLTHSELANAPPLRYP
eukprot:1896517-Prymnesium_polylepis.1